MSERDRDLLQLERQLAIAEHRADLLLWWFLMALLVIAALVIVLVAG